MGSCRQLPVQFPVGERLEDLGQFVFEHLLAAAYIRFPASSAAMRDGMLKQASRNVRELGEARRLHIHSRSEVLGAFLVFEFF